jgi:hypothetical protein
VLNDNGVGSAPISLLKEQVVVIAGRAINYLTVPRSAEASAWVCSGYTPYRALKRAINPGLLSAKGENRLRADNQALNLVKRAIAAAIFMISAISKLLGVRLGARPKRSASYEPWGSQPSLATNPLLSLGAALPEEGALISKPVLLG